jgi:hypothetical protein
MCGGSWKFLIRSIWSKSVLGTHCHLSLSWTIPSLMVQLDLGLLIFFCTSGGSAGVQSWLRNSLSSPVRVISILVERNICSRRRTSSLSELAVGLRSGQRESPLAFFVLPGLCLMTKSNLDRKVAQQPCLGFNFLFVMKCLSAMLSEQTTI